MADQNASIVRRIFLQNLFNVGFVSPIILTIVYYNYKLFEVDAWYLINGKLIVSAVVIQAISNIVVNYLMVGIKSMILRFKDRGWSNNLTVSEI